MNGQKSLKSYAKDAKKRLKSNFWQDYKQNLNEKLSSTQNVSDREKSRVYDYFQSKIASSVKGLADKNSEEFYLKVKSLLDTYGDVSDAIGRLTDKEYFSSLNYEQKQRYTLDLSQKYLKAKERYYKEKQFE
ncbi:MAG: hypothetical protein J6R88_03245 [Clostridia bacterium]|nr:hypothetical protein [Clostridia bacterium]